MATFTTRVEGFPNLDAGVPIGKGRLLMLRFDAQTDGTGGIANNDLVEWIWRVPSNRFLAFMFGMNYYSPTSTGNSGLKLSHDSMDADVELYHAFLYGLKTGVPIPTPTIRWRKLEEFTPPPLTAIEGFGLQEWLKQSTIVTSATNFSPLGTTADTWNRLFAYPNETIKTTLKADATWAASKAGSITFPVIQYPVELVDELIFTALDRAMFRR